MVPELADLGNLPTVLKWYSNPLHFHGRLVRCGLYGVILSVLDPRKCEYLKDYSLDFEHAYMTTIYKHFQHLL
jgi:hypothetical protein